MEREGKTNTARKQKERGEKKVEAGGLQPASAPINPVLSKLADLQEKLILIQDHETPL